MLKRQFITMIFATTSCFYLLASASAGEKETRLFSVYIDNKPAGNYQMQIEPTVNNGVQMTAKANVALRVLLVNYRYQFQGVELWKEGRLQSFQSNCVDDGKKYSVSLQNKDNQQILVKNNQSELVKGDIWLSTYWQLPSQQIRNNGFVLIDADTGKSLKISMDKIGLEKVMALGQTVELMHYRLKGDVKVDLWYDGSNRLIRQESIEDGHKMLMQISQLQRTK